MATYNGEKHIRQQLDSLASQDSLPFELVVGDDGSTDRTMEILEDFQRTAPFPVAIHRNPQRLGYGDNFLTTASRCSGDWIAFCDQDDVWLSHRISDCRSAIEVGGEDIVMVLQTAWIVDAELQGQRRVFPRPPRRRVFGRNQHYGFWVWLGFCQTIRADLITEIQWQERPANYFPGYDRQSHDKWTCMLANALGNIQYLPRPAALYRRHETALTGSYARQSPVARIAKAAGTDADHYRFLSGVARDSAQCLRRLAGTCSDTLRAERLDESARLFDVLATMQARRADLYLADGLVARLGHYAGLWAAGGYAGRPFYSAGMLSAAKDLARVVRLI